jgi:hypothetical protein
MGRVYGVREYSVKEGFLKSLFKNGIQRCMRHPEEANRMLSKRKFFPLAWSRVKPAGAGELR